MILLSQAVTKINVAVAIAEKFTLSGGPYRILSQIDQSLRIVGVTPSVTAYDYCILYTYTKYL